MAWARSQTFAKSTEFNGTGGSTTAATLGASVAAGDTLMLMTTVGLDPSTLGSSTVTDNISASNVYNRLASANGGMRFSSIDGQGWDAWWSIIVVGGTPTVTYTPGGGSRAWIALKGSHFTGSDAASTKRDSKGANQTHPGTGANAISSGSVASAASGDLLWACTADGSATTTKVAGTGFTGSTVDATSGMLDEWLTASGAAAGTFTDATNGGSKVYGTMAIAITPASGGGGGRTFFMQSGLDGHSSAGPKQFNPTLYHRHPSISLEAYHRERERLHRAFMAKVRRAA
jgi:hypothetical protein